MKAIGRDSVEPFRFVGAVTMRLLWPPWSSRQKQQETPNEDLGIKQEHYDTEAIASVLEEQKTKNQNIWSDKETHYANEAKFWRKQIGVGKALNWITGVAAVIAVCGLVGLIISVIDSKQAVVEANRAWIAVDKIYSDQTTFYTTPPSLLLRVEFRDVGKAPANDINIPGPSVTFSPYSESSIGADVQWPTVDSCTGVTPKKHGMIAYPPPSGSYTLTFGVPIKPEMAGHIKGVLEKTEAMLVAGCIAYETFAQPHYTQYCFFFRREPDNTIKAGECRSGAYAN